MSFIPGRLDNNEIIEKLKAAKYPTGFKMTQSKAQRMVEMFWRMDAYNSLISREIYLDHLIEFIKTNKKLSETRFEFLNYVFEKSIPDVALFEKLDDLAINMEYFQANEINKNRFVYLLKDDGVTKEQIDFLYDKSIIEDRPDPKNKEIIKTGFYHHIIQEFLAAKNFLRTEPIKKLNWLTIVELKKGQPKAINPSWYGTIRFLLESDIQNEVLTWLLDLVNVNPEIIDEYFSETVTSINQNKIDSKIKELIYKKIYDNFQTKAVWLPTWARDPLAKFASIEDIKNLKKQIDKKGTETEKIVRRGNILEILAGVLEFRPIDIGNDRKYWKKKLVELIREDDKENGVIKRKSLDALAFYEDPKLIPILEKYCASHKESLVRETFIEFCGKTDPNDQNTIRIAVDGIKGGSSIYGRNTLYRIDKKKGIIELLNHFGNDENFVKEFIDDESIFNKEDVPQDKFIIDQIKKFWNEEILDKSKKAIIFAFNNNQIYEFGNSYFYKELADLVAKNDSKFIFEAIKEIGKFEGGRRWHLLCNYEDLFSWILEKEDLSKFFKAIKKLDEDKTRIAEGSVWKARRIRKDGENLKDVAIKSGLMKDLRNEMVYKDPKVELYEKFQKLLKPAPKKYSPNVFEFFNRNKEDLNKQITDKELNRLKKLALDLMSRIDPRKIEITIENFGKDGARNFRITEFFNYYGDLIRVIEALVPDALDKYRQNLIDFIPFSYSEDETTIQRIVGKINIKELSWINNIYSNKKDDRRYFIPSAYLYMSEKSLRKKQDKKEIIKITKTFINDEKISSYDQKHALRVIGKLVKKLLREKKYFEKIFNDGVENDNESKKELAEIVNRILIRKFKDNKAIDWRIEQIKKKQNLFEEFVYPKGAHSVGDVENELNWFYFAKPLFKLKNEKYFKKLLPLLDLSVERLKNDDRNKVWPFVNYLWNIFFKYLENVDLEARLKVIEKSKKWAKKNKEVNDMNWFQEKLEKSKSDFLIITRIGKKTWEVKK